MNHCNIHFEIKNTPELDPGFIPLYKFNEAFLKTAAEPFRFAIERNDRQISVTNTFIHGNTEYKDADNYYIERLVKTQLWQKGGFRVFVHGNHRVYQMLEKAYSPHGIRAFDAEFMAAMYENAFEVIECRELPAPFELAKSVGRHYDGCRIGFDAGGSDNKISAVIDGAAVYSKETVWHPKQNADPDYHYRGIVSAFKDAAKHLPRIDTVGISSAGIIANNRVLYAQLFQKVPKDLFDRKSRDVYIRAVKDTFGDIPFEVANDGDVAALAGSIGLDRNSILGVAMGTSVAGGFVDSHGGLPNWMNEIAFMPVDASPAALTDDWTGDAGVAVHYFCQEAVIKLAPYAGIPLETYETPAEKLKAVQTLLDEGSDSAAAIFRTIGCYLGHTAVLYFDIYGAENILLLGRVMSGKGGNIIEETARAILREEYPGIGVELVLPDEKTRRLGQSVIAASLPEIRKHGE